ncbi:MAG: divergent PAP2 family protein [Clostridia bacterium]|nr:divergent PAP2 family protein [Clostridia bacterium]
MQYITDLLTNCTLWVPIMTWIIAQLTKMIVNLCVEKRFDLERLIGDGGMPSAHSATVSALMAIVGWGCGFGSAYFAIATMFAVVVVHDATGVRREAGKHATSILQIVESLNGLIEEKDEKIRTERLKELVGHTPLQAFFGVLLGWVVVTVFLLISKMPYGFMLI